MRWRIGAWRQRLWSAVLLVPCESLRERHSRLTYQITTRQGVVRRGWFCTSCTDPMRRWIEKWRNFILKFFDSVLITLRTQRLCPNVCGDGLWNLGSDVYRSRPLDQPITQIDHNIRSVAALLNYAYWLHAHFVGSRRRAK